MCIKDIVYYYVANNLLQIKKAINENKGISVMIEINNKILNL